MCFLKSQCNKKKKKTKPVFGPNFTAGKYDSLPIRMGHLPSTTMRTQNLLKEFCFF